MREQSKLNLEFEILKCGLEIDDAIGQNDEYKVGVYTKLYCLLLYDRVTIEERHVRECMRYDSTYDIFQAHGAYVGMERDLQAIAKEKIKEWRVNRKLKRISRTVDILYKLIWERTESGSIYSKMF